MSPSPVNATAQNGWGFLNTTFTVWVSRRSIRVISSYTPRELLAVGGALAHSQLKITSAAVKGAPSCHCTFFLSRQITHWPSLATPPLATLGISSARTGANVPSDVGADSGSRQQR